MRLTRHQYCAAQTVPLPLDAANRLLCILLTMGSSSVSSWQEKHRLKLLKIICSNFPSQEFSSMSWTKVSRGRTTMSLNLLNGGSFHQCSPLLPSPEEKEAAVQVPRSAVHLLCTQSKADPRGLSPQPW